jgi:hypothetical protein
MEPSRFDRLASTFATNRFSRRAALAAGGAGAAGLTAVALGAAGRPASLAQDATPAAGAGGPAFLFVQLFEQGTWAPKPGEEGVYLLTLAGAGTQTLYFSDRPERIVGTVPTDRFLDALGFTPVNPPNAAVVVQTAEGERDVLVVELLNPVYTRTFGEVGGDFLTYEAKVLAEYRGEGLEAWVPQADDDQLPQEFTQVSLFIDDCPDLTWCMALTENSGISGSKVGPIPGGPIGTCWGGLFEGCQPCNKSLTRASLARQCDQAHPGPGQCDYSNLRRRGRCWVE